MTTAPQKWDNLRTKPKAHRKIIGAASEQYSLARIPSKLQGLRAPGVSPRGPKAPGGGHATTTKNINKMICLNAPDEKRSEKWSTRNTTGKKKHQEKDQSRQKCGRGKDQKIYLKTFGSKKDQSDQKKDQKINLDEKTQKRSEKGPNGSKKRSIEFWNKKKIILFGLFRGGAFKKIIVVAVFCLFVTCPTLGALGPWASWRPGP